MAPQSKKIIIILLVSIFLLSIFSIPLIALAQQQGAGQLAPIAPPNADEGKGFFSRVWSAIVETFIGISSGILLFAAGIIGKLLGFFFSWIIYFEAWILDSAISGFNITNAKIVQIGWAATRDLANMTFILALIIIAISTILRVKAFAAQQMLWRVIVAALLVNFSLIFGGVIIDASQMLAKFFVNAATGNNPAQFSIRLAHAMDITAFYNPGTGSFSGSIFKGVNQIWVAPTGIILGLVALVVMTFVFGAAAFFMLVRVIWLWILLIFAPLAWAALAFPGQSKYFSEWWHKLFHWAFFAPVFTFFMWLSLHLFQENGKLAKGVFSSVVPALGNKSIAYVEASAPEAIMQFGLMIGLMVAGLMVAKKSGVYGAQGSLNMLTKWGESAKNFAGRQLRKGALAVGAVAAAPGVAAKPGLLVRGAQKVAALPGGRFVTGQVFKMAAAETKTIEDAKAQFGSWTNDAVKNYLKTPGGPNNLQMGAALALQERGKLEDLGEARIEQLAALASHYAPKNLDTILKTAPNLAPKFKKPGETDAEAIARVTNKVDKASEIVETSLIPEVVLNFKPDQYKDMIRAGNDDKIQIVKNIVQQEYNNLATSLRTEIDNIVRITNKDARNRALGELSRRDRHAGKVASAKFTTESPAWEI